MKSPSFSSSLVFTHNTTFPTRGICRACSCHLLAVHGVIRAQLSPKWSADWWRVTEHWSSLLSGFTLVVLSWLLAWAFAFLSHGSSCWTVVLWWATFRFIVSAKTCVGLLKPSSVWICRPNLCLDVCLVLMLCASFWIISWLRTVRLLAKYWIYVANVIQFVSKVFRRQRMKTRLLHTIKIQKNMYKTKYDTSANKQQ